MQKQECKILHFQMTGNCHVRYFWEMVVQGQPGVTCVLQRCCIIAMRFDPVLQKTFWENWLFACMRLCTLTLHCRNRGWNIWLFNCQGSCIYKGLLTAGPLQKIVCMRTTRVFMHVTALLLNNYALWPCNVKKCYCNILHFKMTCKLSGF